jgi:hypothetical protein
MPNKRWQILITAVFFLYSFSASAEESDKKVSAMNNERLNTIIHRLDKNVEGEQGFWQFKISKLTVTVITDEKADRMRIIIPVLQTDQLEQKYLVRIMQANFDSALDARYAIAKDLLWSAYIHPLSTLSDDEFILGLAQTVNLVTTFGSSYSSGLLSFQGGDSNAIREKQLIQELLDKGLAI